MAFKNIYVFYVGIYYNKYLLFAYFCFNGIRDQEM